jgi:hypothetical protein
MTAQANSRISASTASVAPAVNLFFTVPSRSARSVLHLHRLTTYLAGLDLLPCDNRDPHHEPGHRTQQLLPVWLQTSPASAGRSRLGFSKT